MKNPSIVLLALLALAFSGCAKSTMYTWGNYDTKLYKYYKNPENLDSLTEELEDIIEKGEEKDNVPPGIYAEYGYLLLEQGQLQEALVCFEKEKLRWPESAPFMERTIANIGSTSADNSTPESQSELKEVAQ